MDIAFLQEPLPKRPLFYLSLDQVRDSGLLSPERFTELQAQIDQRLGYVFDAQGQRITTCRLADLSPYGRFIYPEMPHEKSSPWDYAKREILGVVLTEEERNLLSKCAFEAASARRDEQRFEKAEKIHERHWATAVFLGDTYYEDTEALHDYLMGEVEEPDDYPRYAWAAKPERVIPDLDVADVVGHLIDDRGWEEMDLHDLEGVPELQAALETFTKANEGVMSYSPDYSKAILLDIPSGAADGA